MSRLRIAKSLQTLSALRHFLLQNLLPNNCLLCRQSSATKELLCAACLQDLPWLDNTCLQCALPLTGNIQSQRCGACLKTTLPFSQILAIFHYQTPVDKLINDLKFHSRLVVATLFANLLAKKIRASYHAQALPELLIPVPLHPRRLHERGYNQAAEVARQVAKLLDIKLDVLSCQRVIHTAAQSQIPAEQRYRNIKNAFTVDAIHAKHVAIIDDVVTTMSTVKELTLSLRKQGVQQIDVWTIARTSYKL